MKCQKCHKRVLEQGHRWCTVCSHKMTLAEKIEAQRAYKEHCLKVYETARQELNKTDGKFSNVLKTEWKEGLNQ